MADIKRHNWRTIILDEVHCAAAVAASTCWRQLAADKIYGLTATLVRADNGVEALLQHVGPKVFEMGWRSLEADGFTAIVDPVVMFCNTPDDWQALDKHVDAMADVLNPVKVAACDAIRRRHHDERIIIFCDKLWACEILALRYTCPFLIGDTPDSERQEMLAAFREGVYTTIVLSRVGDTGWDIDASVAIVVDAHFGSERQEAQRIGRIMRPNANGMHSTFYDLVTNKDGCTRCFWHRHDYVRKLGYTFETRDATKLILEQRVSVDPQDLLAEISRHAAVLADRLSRTCDREKTSAERMQRYEDKANVRKAHPLFKKRARNRFQNRWGTAA